PELNNGGDLSLSEKAYYSFPSELRKKQLGTLCGIYGIQTGPPGLYPEGLFGEEVMRRYRAYRLPITAGFGAGRAILCDCSRGHRWIGKQPWEAITWRILSTQDWGDLR